MKRVPAWVVLEILRQEADKTGDNRYRVTGGALRNWVWRGHVTRGSGGYDLTEILAYLQSRSVAA